MAKKSGPRCHCYENMHGYIGPCPVHDKPRLSASQINDAAKLRGDGMSSSDAYRLAAMYGKPDRGFSWPGFLIGFFVGGPLLALLFHYL